MRSFFVPFLLIFLLDSAVQCQTNIAGLVIQTPPRASTSSHKLTIPKAEYQWMHSTEAPPSCSSEVDETATQEQSKDPKEADTAATQAIATYREMARQTLADAQLLLAEIDRLKAENKQLRELLRTRKAKRR